ncbi:MAG: glucan phosphorylase [Microbacterium sp.]|nr:glucan phosphorylase [Microbacterium sp.]
MKSETGLAAIGMALMISLVVGIVFLSSGALFGSDRYVADPSAAPLRLTTPSLLFESPSSVKLAVENAREDLNWSVHDHSGQVVSSGTTAVAASDRIDPELSEPGFYTFSVDDGRGPLQADLVVTGSIPKTPEPFFSVATHWGKQTFASSTWPIESTLPLVTGLGIREFRDETTWTSVERATGQLTMPDFANDLTLAARVNDMRMLFVASYGNPRAYPGDMSGPMSPPTTKEGRAAFVDYINSVLDSNPTIDKVEVWNEFNRPGRNTSDCQSGTCYATLVKAVYQGVKSKHPDVKIVAGNTHGIPTDFFTDFATAGGLKYADMISTHGYAADVADLRNGIRRLDNIVRAHNGGRSKPIIVSEVGLTNTTVTPPLGNVGRVLDEDQAAGGLVQIFVTLKSLPPVSQAVWYDAVNDGTDPAHTEANFGLFQQPTRAVEAFQPKVGAAAMATTIRQLDGYTFTSVTRLSGDVTAYTFTNDAGNVRRVMWKNQPFLSTDDSTTTVPIATSAGRQTTITSMTGQTLRVLADGPAIVQAGGMPIFVDEEPAGN